MAVKMNLWSMTLLPGEKYPMLVRRDFQITNVALGEELRDENGRSVVKVTHNPIDPAAFDTDSEIDSDFDDSDDEFDMDGDDSVDEEVDDEEDDEEEEADVEAKKKVKAVAKEALKARKDVEMDEDEDEDEDEEDDEEFDSDDEEALEVNVICSLLAGKVEQAQVNLTFVEGEVVMFEASGENAVHLLGNYIDQFPDVDSDSEFDSEEDDYDDYSALYDDEDDEDESGPEIEELEEEAEVEVKPKKAIKAAAAAPVKEEKAAATPAATGLKRKSDAVESPAGKTAEAAAASGEGLSKAQKKKLAKKAKLEGADAAPAPAAAATAEKPKPKAQNAPQKRTTASGLIIEDITVGTGPVAKGGKRLGMRYIGKLTSGKQFDANTAGKPFSFVLGRGEVIKGWDEGLVGMAVGGERRLTIPPQLAYGKRASGPIPANSTLKFDVKLVSVN